MPGRVAPVGGRWEGFLCIGQLVLVCVWDASCVVPMSRMLRSLHMGQHALGHGEMPKSEIAEINHRPKWDVK